MRILKGIGEFLFGIEVVYWIVLTIGGVVAFSVTGNLERLKEPAVIALSFVFMLVAYRWVARDAQRHLDQLRREREVSRDQAS